LYDISCVMSLAYFLPRCMQCKRGLAMRILSVCPSVCLSVCLSVCQTRDLWQNGRKSCPNFYTIRKVMTFSLVYWEEEWLVGATPSTWNFGATGPRWNKIADFQPMFADSSSAVTPSEKSSINTNMKSTTRFPISLRWSTYVAHGYLKRGLKNAKRLKKVCY